MWGTVYGVQNSGWNTKPRTAGTGPSEVEINGYLVSVKQDE